MQRDCCDVSFAFILKFLNFLQAFIGVSIILYSVWMLDQWNHHMPVPHPYPYPYPYPYPQPRPHPHPHPHPPLIHTPVASLNSQIVQSRLLSHDHHQAATTGPLDVTVSGFDDVSGFGFDLNSFRLPAAWFIYSFMGVGVLVCCVTLIGCIAAEAISGCCLCIYALLKTVLIVLEAALVAFTAIDRHWEKDLPFDPTGELDSLRSFIEDNIDICKWVGITVIVIQALSLLLALILRAMASTRRTHFDEADYFDEEDYYEYESGRIRVPLLYHQPRNAHSDLWSSRIREQYGLNNNGEKYTLA